jgi:hypothetical protein
MTGGNAIHFALTALGALMTVHTLFEDELRRRGVRFTIDAESGRHAVEDGERRMLVSLENLQRGLAEDGDFGRVSRFVDAVLAPLESRIGLCVARLYWSLESVEYKERAEFREPVSEQVDRVLVHLSLDPQVITWVTSDMLCTLGLPGREAGARAFENLATALREGEVESMDIDGVSLGIIATRLPFKASLILAPNLKEAAGDTLGWPLMAVAPDRDFLYLWAARHTDFIGRVGGVVVREYLKASYPLSTEVYEINDQGIRAVGAFPVKLS